MDIQKKNYINSVRFDYLSTLLKPWQKRNNRLLHIGLGHGIEPSFFWDMGFDVSVLCNNQEEFEQCQERNGKKIEYFIGKSEHLPFNEKIFDYVVISHDLAHKLKHNAKLKNTSRKEKAEELLSIIVEEAQRVSTKSICILEFSSLAFTTIQPALSPFILRQLTQMEKYSKNNHEEKQSEFMPDPLARFSSALHMPSIFWTKKPLPFSAYPLNIPFGSLMAVVIDHSPFLMTSLPLQIQQTATEISS